MMRTCNCHQRRYVVQTFTAPGKLEDVQKVVGGYVETVPVRNIEGHYLLMVDEDARLQWPRPVAHRGWAWPARRFSARWF